MHARIPRVSASATASITLGAWKLTSGERQAETPSACIQSQNALRMIQQAIQQPRTSAFSSYSSAGKRAIPGSATGLLGRGAGRWSTALKHKSKVIMRYNATVLRPISPPRTILVSFRRDANCAASMQQRSRSVVSNSPSYALTKLRSFREAAKQAEEGRFSVLEGA